MKRIIATAVFVLALSSGARITNAAVFFDGTFTPSVGSAGYLGFDSGSEKRAQSFTSSESFTFLGGSVSLRLSNATTDGVGISNPTDNLIISLYSDFAAAPSTPVTGWSTFSIPAASISDAYSFHNISITGPSLPTSTKFWLVFERSGPISGTDGFYVEIATVSLGDLVPGELNMRFSPWTFVGDRDFNLLLDSSPISASNEIVDPPAGPYTITSIPFPVNGTCDSGSQNQLEVLIYETSNPLNVIDRKYISCELSDTWSAGTMGSSAWNTGITVELYDIIEGSLGDRVIPPLDSHAVTINVSGNTNIIPPVIDPGVTDPDFGFLGNLIRDAITWLFVPSPELFNRFGNLWELVKQKPPLGYITASLGALGDLEQGTSPEELEGTTQLSSYFNPIKNVVSALLWTLTAVYLFRRVGSIRI